MRVVILTNQQRNQTALAAKIANVAEVAGIVLSDNVPRRSPSLANRARSLVNGAAGRILGRRLVEAWSGMLARYESSSWPTDDITRVRNVNDPATLETLERLRPDLVVVSGTNIVGRRIIEAANTGRGIVNLHTGISPYVRGGPNCTNWCLARGWFHLIGNTVMWLDAGIDTGNIIATERTPLTGDESLSELHWTVMEHAHDLYVRAIRLMAEGKKVGSVVQSSVAAGSHFRNADWNALQMRRALRNFDRGYRDFFRGAVDQRRSEVRLYPLEDV